MSVMLGLVTARGPGRAGPSRGRGRRTGCWPPGRAAQGSSWREPSAPSVAGASCSSGSTCAPGPGSRRGDAGGSPA
eukprot:5261128-Pyramimonas_sp.AAC.1